MAKQIVPPDEMDSLYGGTESPAPAAGPGEESEPAAEEASESVDQETAEGGTAVIDNKVLSPEGQPLKEGDEIVLVVVKNYGEESEVKYAPKEKGAEQPPGGGMEEANAELDAMGKE